MQPLAVQLSDRTPSTSYTTTVAWPRGSAFSSPLGHTASAAVPVGTSVFSVLGSAFFVSGRSPATSWVGGMGWTACGLAWPGLVLQETPLAEPLRETLAYVVLDQIPNQHRFLTAPTDMRDGDRRLGPVSRLEPGESDGSCLTGVPGHDVGYMPSHRVGELKRI